jgi:hypothetical protein
MNTYLPAGRYRKWYHNWLPAAALVSAEIENYVPP